MGTQREPDVRSSAEEHGGAVTPPHLDCLPCPALLFDFQGQLLGLNSKAHRLHAGAVTPGATTLEHVAQGVEYSGQQLTAAEVAKLLHANPSLEFHQQVNGVNGPVHWLLCQASHVQDPATGKPAIMLIQVDITSAKPPAVRAVEQGLREQMQVLQRKLLRAVTENEALRHAVDKLQEDVLTLHRQLLQAGMLPHVQLDSSFLSPLAHEGMFASLPDGLEADLHSSKMQQALATCEEVAAASHETTGTGRRSSVLMLSEADASAAGAAEDAGAAVGPPSPTGAAPSRQVRKTRRSSFFAPDASGGSGASAAVELLDQLLTTNAMQKAALDRAAVDAADMKQQVNRAAQDSAQFKAALGKAAHDAVVAKSDFDRLADFAEVQQAQLSKAAADAAEFKAGFDKLSLDNAEQQAQLNKAAADAAEYKAGFDKAAADAAEFKAGYDKLSLDTMEQQAQLSKAAADAAEFKAGFDKAAADAAEFKAGYDKLSLDNAEQQAQLCKAAADAAEYKSGFDKAAADAAEFKAGYDKLSLDNAEQQAQLSKAAADAAEFKAGFDKAAADAAEFKAGYDKLSLDNAEQQAQLSKAAADAAEYKSGFDKAAADAAEFKAGFDKAAADAAEFKAGYDKLSLDNAEQQAQLCKAAADAAEYKSGFDKAAADAAEFKAGYDKLSLDTMEQQAQLDKAAADAAEFKAGYDKLSLDTMEQQAQLNKAAADAAEFKAGYDKLSLDTMEQQAQLNKAAADAAEFKAGFDKAAADAAEFKAGYDKLLVDNVEQQAHLDKACADAAEFKAGYDKLAVDTMEQQAQLDKASADAAEFKAGYDKVSADAAEFKAGFDKLSLDNAEQQAQLQKASADAAEYKAGFDKAAADAVEFKAGYDKAAADAAEFKAGYDKVSADAAEFKAGYDKLAVDNVEQSARLYKAAADAAEFKAGYDKLSIDNAEQQAQLSKAAADAAEYKSGFDKAAADAAEFKAGLDKVEADMAEVKVQYGALQAAHDEQKEAADKAAANTAEVQMQLQQERHSLSLLQSQHDALLRQQEVLQAELMMALGDYKPATQIDAGTPADKLLAMMTELLDGSLPTLQDILLIQSTILESRNIYQPFRLGKQLLEAKELEENVGLSLIHLLGDTDTLAEHTGGSCAPVNLQDLTTRPSQRISVASTADSVAEEFATLQSSLLAICGAGSRLLLQPRLSNLPGSKRSSRVGMASNSNLAAGRASAIMHGALLRGSSSEKNSTSGSTCESGEPVLRSSASVAFRQVDSDGNPLVDGESSDDSAAGGGGGEMEVMDPPAPLIDQLEVVLSSAHDWQFDAFALAEASCGHPLSALAFYLFHRNDVITNFNLPPVPLARFLRRMEDGYKINPYHNATHAADVLQTLNAIIFRGGLAPGYVDPLHLMAAYVAAVIHDYEHGGFTNDFLVNCQDDLAIRYNDRSPLENHHLAAAFATMRQPEYNFLQPLSKAEGDKFRKAVIELVLATDMKQHFNILSHFTTVHRINTSGALSPSVTSSVDPAHRVRARSTSSGSTGASLASSHILLPLDENERLLSLQMAIKCADLGHCTAALPVHKRWVVQLEEEFFRQGDVERSKGMSISPLFDRNQQGITKSQVGFFDVVVIPLYHTFGKVFSSCRPLLTYVMRNYNHWTDVQRNAASLAAASGPK